MTNNEINLAIAALDGWTDIEPWNPQQDKDTSNIRTFTGTNPNHLELGRFVPDYAGNLGAIAAVFDRLDFVYCLTKQFSGKFDASTAGEYLAGGEEDTAAIALCKLLIAINPKPVEVEAGVIEAVFG